MSLFHNPRKAVIGICIFLALLIAAFATKCRASELWLEAGGAFTRYHAPAIGFAIDFPKAGPSDTDYLVGLHLIGSADGIGNQSALTLGIVDGFGKLDVMFGLCVLHHKDARNGSIANFFLGVGYRFGRYKTRAAHCSNAGQTETNLGLDLALAGRRFR